MDVLLSPRRLAVLEYSMCRFDHDVLRMLDVLFIIFYLVMEVAVEGAAGPLERRSASFGGGTVPCKRWSYVSCFGLAPSLVDGVVGVFPALEGMWAFGGGMLDRRRKKGHTVLRQVTGRQFACSFQVASSALAHVTCDNVNYPIAKSVLNPT